MVTYVLPGMGADQRMYAGAWHRLPQVRFLDWPKESTASSLAELAVEVIAMAGIEDGAVVVGSSLGGMVAAEIAKRRSLQRLILVGSALQKEEVSALLRLLHPLVGLAPLSFVQRAGGKLPSELCTMFSEADAAFIRNMCRAVFAWEGLDHANVPVSRIHGRFDRVIPPPKDATLLDGGHLIAMTHADACVEFIERELGARWDEGCRA
ncbi:alpha/beta fold hydrolase [Actomonas aquatica]|uniref:Alpha/beta hydrolase n=1 Tax=Actomonas aquatica TaxID=2866162 RepID=A0ABZ1C7U1_9BACT|nr:alpha/beta hydrolase [Opitutus sp. WL0086]WRQ87778.1 alpha/beta hydrolase [Opitutus sp. WL0086]